MYSSSQTAERRQQHANPISLLAGSTPAPLLPIPPHMQGPHMQGPHIAMFTSTAPAPWLTQLDVIALEYQGQVKRLCLWGEYGDLPLLWQRLQHFCAPELFAAIVKVDRIYQQSDSRLRFDIYCQSHLFPQLMESLNAGRRSLGWYYRPHIPHQLCHLTQQARFAPSPLLLHPAEQAQQARGGTVASPRTHCGLKVATYNINGVCTKQFDLQCFLQSTKCDVVALQETLLRETDWIIRMPGYQCVQRPGDFTAATRGVALLVSHQFQLVTVGTLSPYWIFACLSGAPLPHPVIVACVYVPNGTGGRAVLQHFQQQVHRVHVLYPSDPIALLGDFNKDLDEMQLLCMQWPIPMQVLVNSGNVPT